MAKRISKKCISVLLAVAMCLSLACTALAADASSYTITVDNSIKGSTYYAYLIFDATYNEGEGVSYSIQESNPWFSIIQDASEVFELTPIYRTNGSGQRELYAYSVTVKDGKTDDDVIAVINGAITVDEDTGLATLSNGKEISPVATAEGTGLSAKLDVSASGAGYYFVTTTTGTTVSLTTAYPNANVIDKNSVISMDKYMLDKDGNHLESTEDGMDEDVTFDIEADVPMFEGENVVVDYVFTDTLSNGLLIELTEDQFHKGVADNGEDPSKYYLNEEVVNEWVTLYDGSGAETEKSFTESVYKFSFELVDYDVFTDNTTNDKHTFDGFILTYYTFDYDAFKADYEAQLAQWEAEGNDPDDFDFDAESYYAESSYPSNASIEIKYTAHVTSLEGYDNTNDIVLHYDVMPWRHPTPVLTPGEDIKDHNDVYSWELQLLKVDGETRQAMSGVEFTLTSDNMQSVVVGHSYLYVLVEDLKAAPDGIYSYQGTDYKVADFETTDYYYDSDNDEYILEKTDDGPYHRILMDKTTSVTETAHSATGITDSEGHLYFAGLGAGDYVLTETSTPDGYNTVDPIEFTISWDPDTGHFSVDIKTSGYSSGELTDGYILELEVENYTGTVLPGTGGMGTAVFYIVGGVLVAGAAVTLVTRRRMRRTA